MRNATDFFFLHDVHSHLDRNISIDALFLNFERTFSKVPHSRFVLDLSRLNLHLHVSNLIYRFLTNRKPFVYANNYSSAPSPIGGPQGIVVGPLLYLVCINHIPLTVTYKIRIFADDCVLYCPINNLTDVSSVQDSLSRIQHWCYLADDVECE